MSHFKALLLVLFTCCLTIAQQLNSDQQPSIDLSSSNSDWRPLINVESDTKKHAQSANNYYIGESDNGSKGFKKSEENSLKDKNIHGVKHEEGHYSEDGGKKSAYKDEEGNYSQEQNGGKSHKSAKFGEKKGHKKGHKTKGWMNKFFRDEYHREHKFYDDAHKSGHFSKDGDYHKYYDKATGGYKKGGSDDSGKHADRSGNKGRYDKGVYDRNHKGFEGSRGDQSHYNRFKKFGNHRSASGHRKYLIPKTKT